MICATAHPRLRYSLIGREVTQDALCEHLQRGPALARHHPPWWPVTKPPVGRLPPCWSTTCQPSFMFGCPNPSGTDPKTGEKMDIVSAFSWPQWQTRSGEYRYHICLANACPGFAVVVGMFTYNTIADLHSADVLGCNPLHIGGPALRTTAPA